MGQRVRPWFERSGRAARFAQDPSGPQATHNAVDYVLITGTTSGLSGTSTTLTATAYDRSGHAITGVGVTWRSSLEHIATITVLGVVTFADVGSSTITATVDGRAYTTSVTSQPSTPAQLFTAYNSLGGGGAGATMRNVYQRGINQTIGAGKCTRWGDAVDNSRPFLPSADVNSGTGSAVGGNAGTSIIDAGLELPIATMDALMALVQSDPSSISNNPTSGAPAGINGSQVIFDLFADHTKGLTLGAACRMLTNTKTFSLESAGHTDDFYFSPDHFDQWAPLADSLAATGGVDTYDTGSNRFRIGWFLTDTPNNTGRGYSWNFQQFGRDLLKKGKSLNPHPLVTGITGRRLRLGVDNGNPIGHGCEYNLVYLATGRENKAQNKLVNDYIKAQFPDMWEDPRGRLGINLGNSWQEGIDFPFPGGFAAVDIGIAHDVLLGHSARNLARLANCAFFTLAYSGDTIAQMQYAMAQLIGDLDFTSRTRVAISAAEYLNGGNPAQNYYLLDKLRALDPKIHTTHYDITYSSNTSLATNYPVFNDSIDANGLTHSDAVIPFLRGTNSGINVPWRSRNFGDGTGAAYPTGENDQLWAAAHPFTAAFEMLLAPLYQAGILAGLGDNIAAKVVRIMPTNFGLDLIGGGATGNPGTLTCYNYLDTAIAGHTFTYDTIKVDGGVNAGWSSAAAIATVDASGVVTPVATGHCLLRITSDDGAVTFVDVNVTTTVSDTFTRADSAVTLGNAETGQAWSSLGGTWGISSNQAYYVTGSSANNIYAVVDSGKADTTIQVTFSAYDATGEPRICWRAVDLNNLWIVSTGSPTSTIYKRVAGAYTSVTTFTHTWAAGDVVTIVTSGNNHTVKVNGSTLATFTDSFQATATKHGIGQFQIGAGTNRYDNFSVL